MTNETAGAAPAGGRRPRVLFMTEWFEPLQVQKGINFVSRIRDAGYDVDVATSIPLEGRWIPYRRDTMNGIAVYRLPLYRSHDTSGVRRSLTFLSFFLSLLVFGLIRARRYDVIYAYHPPITVGLAAALFGKVWRRPFVLDVLDLWPDGVAESGMARPSIVATINRVCNFTYRHAARISVAAEGFRHRLIERGVPAAKIRLTYNSADENKARPGGGLDLAPYRLEGRFNIVYGGNLGVMQDLPTVISAARLAHARNPALHLILVGAGSERGRLERLAAEAPDVVRVHPSVPMTQIGDLFDAADLLIFHLADRPLFRIYLPGKLAFYLAMGKPILAGIEGEGADIVKAAGAGFTVAPGNPEAIAEAMLNAADTDPETRAAMGQSGREYYMRTMSSELAVRKLLDLLNAAARREPLPREDADAT